MGIRKFDSGPFLSHGGEIRGYRRATGWRKCVVLGQACGRGSWWRMMCFFGKNSFFFLEVPEREQKSTFERILSVYLAKYPILQEFSSIRAFKLRNKYFLLFCHLKICFPYKLQPAKEKKYLLRSFNRSNRRKPVQKSIFAKYIESTSFMEAGNPRTNCLGVSIPGLQLLRSNFF